MARFEDVLNRLDVKTMKEMTDAELVQAVKDLQSIRTDVPQTKHRRKKHRSREHLAKQILQMSKDLGISVESVMEHPDIMKLLEEGE